MRVPQKESGRKRPFESGMEVIVIGMFLWFSGCDSSFSKGSTKWIGYTQTGKASFYSMKFQSRKTASGERFTQLSKPLPIGSCRLE